jgi:hypothetical protein
MSSDKSQQAVTHSLDQAADADRVKEAAHALRNGPVGALVVASIAVGLLLFGWLAFYFLLFMPRGPSG